MIMGCCVNARTNGGASLGRHRVLTMMMVMIGTSRTRKCVCEHCAAVPRVYGYASYHYHGNDKSEHDYDCQQCDGEYD